MVSYKAITAGHSELQQRIDGVLLGRDILYDTKINPQDISEIERVRQLFMELVEKNESHPRSLSFSLHHNSNVTPLKPYPIERPRSAYFTYDPFSDRLIVEWGEVDDNGDAKLHTYLNQAIDYPIRHKEGMVVRSGHIARLKDTNLSYALLDSLSGPGNPVVVPVLSSMHPMVRILSSNRHLVISSDGYLCLPEPRK